MSKTDSDLVAALKAVESFKTDEKVARELQDKYDQVRPPHLMAGDTHS